MIDFHCHIDLYPNPREVMRRCVELGMRILSVTTTPSAWSGTRALQGKAKNVETAIGLHPQVAHQRLTELGLFDQLISAATCVGEIGLDGTPPYRATRVQQLKVLRHILETCKRAGGKVITIHSRAAAGPVIEELRAHENCGVPVLHWFSGGVRHLNDAIAMGCWFSVGPAMLCSRRGLEIAAKLPRDRVLTETDGPFATLGGRSAFPWDVALAIPLLAEVWEVNPEEASAVLERNWQTLSKRWQKDPQPGACSVLAAQRRLF